MSSYERVELEHLPPSFFLTNRQNFIKNLKEHIGNTCDDDINEHAIHIITCTCEDLLGVVEDHIRATPLLEDSDDETQQQHLAIFMLEKLAETVRGGRFFRRNKRTVPYGTFRCHRSL